MSTIARSPSFTLDQPPKKRKKFTRSATGCKPCRSQRVKCPEGPMASSDGSQNGGKVICKRCWETDTPCFYPSNGKSIRRKGGDDNEWERAVHGDYWENLARESQPVNNASEIVLERDDRSGNGEWDWNAFLSDVQSTPLVSTDTSQALPNLDERITTIGSSTDGAISLPNRSTAFLEDPTSQPIDPFTLMTTTNQPRLFNLEQVSTSTPTLEWLNSLLFPTPPPVLNTFTLASLLPPDIISETSRNVVSYFEHEGCNEIVSASKRKHNWIVTQLFPKLFATLTTSSNDPDTVDGLVREWLQACLVQISYVHRANLERDVSKRYIWKSKGDKARQRANYALLRAKLKYPEGQWKTEEYLMGFFVRCMADMLAATKLVIDDTTAFELPLESATPFYTSLRDLIALYSVIDHACTPLSPSLAQSPRFLMPTQGPEWVERFVGFSRRIIIKLGQVSGLVINRWQLIQAGTDSGVAGILLKTQAENLLAQLGDGWDWEEHMEDVGQPDRIQRGNGVMRCALQTQILCEILDVDLNDRRLAMARSRAIELVVDAEPSSLGGFQWPLTILAIYARDKEARSALRTVLRQALELSFGTGYRGTDEVLSLCWEVLDSKDEYNHGIAPWREALAAFERSLFV